MAFTWHELNALRTVGINEEGYSADITRQHTVVADAQGTVIHECLPEDRWHWRVDHNNGYVMRRGIYTVGGCAESLEQARVEAEGAVRLLGPPSTV